MAKRGTNIYKRKDGRWEGRIRRKDSTGALTGYRSIYGSSYREVREKMAVVLTAQEPEKNKSVMTVNQVLELWMRDKRSFWKDTTFACYRQLVDRLISEEIGREKAQDFTNARYHSYINNLVKRDNSTKISAAYAHNIGAVIRQAFNYVSSEYDYELPMLTNKRTERAKETTKLPSDSTMKTLTNYLFSHTEDLTCVGILLAYYTGIRIGELCALTWDDIDMEEGVLRIRKNMQRVKDYERQGEGTSVRVQSPKTQMSARTIPIPDPLITILAEKQGLSDEYLVQGRKKAWAEARTVQYRFAAIQKACGIEHFNFHMLRHYFASLCIRRGVDVKSLSEILGHSSVQITLNIYVHSSMEQKRHLMNQVFVNEM